MATRLVSSLDCDCSMIKTLINAKIQQLLDNQIQHVNTALQPTFTYYCDEPVNDPMALALKASLEVGFGGQQRMSVSAIVMDFRIQDSLHFLQEQKRHYGDHASSMVSAEGDTTSIYLGKYQLPDHTFVTIGTRFDWLQ